MSENSSNNSGPSVLPILLFIFAGVIYQKHEYILKALSALLHKLMLLSLYVGSAVLVGWLLHLSYKSVRKKILDFQKWTSEVDTMRAKHQERLDNHRGHTNWLENRSHDHFVRIEQLEAEVSALKAKIEPKKDEAQAEATKQVEEAVQVVVGNSP